VQALLNRRVPIVETFLITGASSGIGLAAAKILLSRGHLVFAGYRAPQTAAELFSLKTKYPDLLNLVVLDVNSDESVASSVRAVSQISDKIDVLVNMAAILPQPHATYLADLDFEHCRTAFETNALGPLRVSRAFLPLLRQAKRPKVINISSGAGSIGGRKFYLRQVFAQYADRMFGKFLQKMPFVGRLSAQIARQGSGQLYAYSTSKTALNMLTCNFAAEFYQEGLICVALDPGWVQTNMGGPNAPLTASESAVAMLNTIRHLTIKHTGNFLNRNGNRLKW
jgi:NAD(P)-dependent dehydrogenase (short-subunit alcohol dehydrogenase family)